MGNKARHLPVGGTEPCGQALGRPARSWESIIIMKRLVLQAPRLGTETRAERPRRSK